MLVHPVVAAMSRGGDTPLSHESRTLDNHVTTRGHSGIVIWSTHVGRHRPPILSNIRRMEPSGMVKVFLGMNHQSPAAHPQRYALKFTDTSR